MNLDNILKLNTNFYKSVNKEFSRTRQGYWKGWERVGDIIRDNFSGNDEISVLDLGCGNGRFLKFLKENLPEYTFKYLGVDTNKELLKEVEGETKELDIFSNLDDLKDKYDIIVGFGITHHMLDKKLRRRWFSNLRNLLNKNGILILTFWDFLYKKDKQTLDDGDNNYTLDWDNKGIKRYCHYYDGGELKEIFKIVDLNLLETYKSDGKTSNLNTYHIYINS